MARLEQFPEEYTVHTHHVLLLKVYSKFDVDGQGTVDWRCMVFMLRVATNAQVNTVCAVHLLALAIKTFSSTFQSISTFSAAGSIGHRVDETRSHVRWSFVGGKHVDGVEFYLNLCVGGRLGLPCSCIEIF